MPETTDPSPAPIAPPDLNDPSLFINRELSLLEFQRRVLDEARNEKTPLLERVKFLSIVGSNIDEFFMVRVAGLRKQIDAGIYERTPEGLTPAEQLAAIRKVAQQLMIECHEHWRDSLLPDLKRAGIYVLEYEELNERQRATVKKYFEDVVFPVLTPLAFDPGHPFPHISNLSLNLAVVIRDEKGKDHFARIKVPNTLPRLLPIKRSSGGVRKDGTVPYEHYFVWLEQVIAHNLDDLFHGMQVVEAHPFRVTRDADIEIQELEAADLLETMEQSMRQRRFGSVVRLAVHSAMPAHIRGILLENLELDRNDVYTLDGPLGISSLMSLYQSVERYDLRELPVKPAIPPALRGNATGDVFDAIRQGDILIHHPYDSFVPVVDFLRAAACDPDVLAIKQTLYRVGRNPPVVETLLEAVQSGKQVAVLVELKARFDEESNIGWARKLESEGVHVTYGLLGLKTHSKIALVIRKEGDGIRRYMHLATGNYNAVTAQLYEDIGMFTCDDEIGADVTDLFNYLTGYSAKQEYRKLLVAPINLRQRLEALVEREVEHHRNGRPAHLIFKVNHLVDTRMIQGLYRASQAGLKIDLIVRGTCCLRPGVPGVSENIRVHSVVGRFLEHSRIYYFHNGGDEAVYLGSADVMPRNLDRRVEVLFPVQQADLIHRIRDDILLMYLKENARCYHLLPNGLYERPQENEKRALFNVQSWFLKQRE